MGSLMNSLLPATFDFTPSIVDMSTVRDYHEAPIETYLLDRKFTLQVFLAFAEGVPLEFSRVFFLFSRVMFVF